MEKLRERLYYLYESNERQAIRFRYALFFFDVLILVYLIASSFFYGNNVTEAIDVVFGLLILIDFFARLIISPSIVRCMFHPLTLVDIAVILSLLLPVVGENFAFLRVVRIFRLLRSYHVLEHLETEFSYFKKYRDIIVSCLNLVIFIFVMTALVFESQVTINKQINNYLDALYFTVSTLTTTGFGDITMMGSGGRLIAVLIMIFGVSLFIRLIQTIFRPSKVRFECTNCGLYLHDSDAIHCKHCGETIAIPDDGLD